MRHAIALGFVLAATAAPAQAADHLPDGATIAGVPVGGLGPYGARVALQDALRPTFETPIAVAVKGRSVSVPTASLGQRVEYLKMVDAAFAQLSRGDLVHVRLIRTIDGDALTARTAAIARPYLRRARNARVRFGIRRVARIPGRSGRGVDTARLRKELLAELRRPTTARRVRAHMRTFRPAVTVRSLRSRYRTYISVDRGARIVRLFKRLRRVRSYRVAVGAAGYDTPRGLHHVLYKERNPTWHVPNRPWAGSLAGMTIPPGDWRNPLKARFIALGGGVGFHGTADLASIGQAASHGCIRMRVPDVISLYNRTPVGTPVLIR
jgi:lipoprotein-anchoring transpeptidase ErfK/SrfK